MKVFQLLLAFCLCAVLSTANRIPLDASRIDPFDTMDDYSLLDIFDWVSDFGDMVNVASLSPRVRQFILDHKITSENNLENAYFYIEISGSNHVYGGLKHRYVGGYYKTLFRENDHILATLKAFCTLFSRLEITLDYFSSHDNFTINFIDYVNRYCSSVPQKLSIKWPNYPIQEFTAWNVSSVEIEKPERIKDFSISEHFPRVEELHLNNRDYFTSTEHLPHLKHLELSDDFCGHFNFRAFAEKNPQITSAKLVLCDGLDILQEVNELLPNLVSLDYEPRRYVQHTMEPREENTVQSVQFRNVKTYTINLEDYFKDHRNDSYFVPYFDGFSQIQFDQLKRLEYISGGNLYKFGQLNFVGQYKEVESLKYDSYRLSFEEVWHLVNSLPSLKEFTFLASESLTAQDDFVRFLEETNLDTIHTEIDNKLVDEFRTLSRSAEWDLNIGKYGSSAYSKFISFSRKRNATN